MKFGLKWRIGNGDSVRVWGDKWLPTPLTYKVSSPRLFLIPDTWVGELINKEEACWKSGVVDSLLMPHEAVIVKGILISSRLPEDKQVWAFDPKGLFSVKSAYWGAVELSQSECSGSCSDVSHERRFSKLLWSPPVPHKLRHFAWRACRDVLPIKSNLMLRKILQDSTCEECGLTVETTGHLFWSCPRAQEMWACSKLVIPFERDECLSFKDLIWRLLMGDASRIEVAAKVITGAWSLWNNQNEVRVGDARKIGADLIKRAVQYMEEFIAATELPVSTPVLEAQFLAWVPPTTHYFKVNVDGATFAKQKAAGVGVIIRDDVMKDGS